MKETKAKSKMREQKAITLIALIITIIVLLILAGVSIVSLTGENGLLKKATKAKEVTSEEGAIEKVQIEVMGSYNNDVILDLDLLNKNLKNIPELTYNGNPLSEDNKIAKLPVIVVVDGYKVLIDKNGRVEKPLTLEEAKNKGKIFKEKTEITDPYGNKVTIPEGFKIATDSATDVTGGIVIEDVDHTETKGSQFVWIPVGAINCGDEIKTINIDRYSFSSEDGNPVPKGNVYIDNCIEREVAMPEVLNAFKNKSRINDSGGFYIGRFEARSENGILVYKADANCFKDITRADAISLSRSMYSSYDNSFICDLMNSYAWDTATVFLQIFDKRENNTVPYSLQESLNTSYAPKGTINLTNSEQQDIICNVWDMASNLHEWSTEYYRSTFMEATSRGGYYLQDNYNHSYTSYRNDQFETNRLLEGTFRTVMIF